MDKHAYYMIQRPFSPGSQPKHGLVEAEDFGGRKHVKEIGREAWSRIVYDRELTEKEIEQYELVPAEPKLYYGIGAQMLVRASYGNGFSEKFEYITEE